MGTTKVNSSYKIKPEYLKVPSISIPNNRMLLRFISWAIALTRIPFRWDKRIRVKKYTVSGPNKRPFKVIVVEPKDVKRKAGALLYYHGGGFFMTYASLHLQHAQEYALAASAKVFIVDYSLSYKDPFPAGLNDCYAALEWAHRNANMLGVDRDKISVGGDSAGGAYAAVVAQMARDRGTIPLKAQILIYPVIDCACKTKSATQFTDTPLWRAQDNKTMWQVYLRDSHYVEGKSPPQYASPIHCANLKNLPPAYIESAEYDPLRDEAHEYAQALEASGVAVHLVQTKGTIHGYDFVKNSSTTQKYYRTRMKQILLHLA